MRVEHANLRSGTVAILFALGVSNAFSDWVPTWNLGEQDGSAAEFAGSGASADYEVGQPLSQLRGAWNSTQGTPSSRITFDLSASEAGGNAVMRFLVSVTDLQRLSTQGTWLGAGWHDVTLRLNGELLATERDITERHTWVVQARAIDSGAVVGENVLEIGRAGGAPGYGQISLDALRLEIDPVAYADLDSDGIPSYWERRFGLDPEIGSDASLDPDADGLSNLVEFYAGTNPWRADTDGDGLADGEERMRVLSPLSADTDGDGLSDTEEEQGALPSDPTLADSDGDGAADPWERLTGNDPKDAADFPAPFAGAIGLQFITTKDSSVALAPAHVDGPYPQRGWNVTIPLPSDAIFQGGLSEVRAPVAGGLRYCDGSSSGLVLNWDGLGGRSSANSGTLTGNLLNGYITAEVNSGPATLSLSDIPFSRYDVYVGLTSSYNNARGLIELVGQPDTARLFMSAGVAPQDEWLPAESLPDEVEAEVAGITDPQLRERMLNRATRRATYAVFRDLTPEQLQIRLSAVSGEVGISTIQVVDTATDTDSDGLPDSWEIINGNNLSVADAGSDRDGDGLDAAGEYANGGDPRDADSDRDGVPDGEELERKSSREIAMAMD